MKTLPFAAILFCLTSATASCKKSACEKYGEMEVTCDPSIPESQRSDTRVMATEFCKNADDKEAGEFGAMLKREAECADKHNGDCAAYKACTDAFKAK